MTCTFYTPGEATMFLEHALSDPDEAWQDFFDGYIISVGTAENVKDIRFS